MSAQARVSKNGGSGRPHPAPLRTGFTLSRLKVSARMDDGALPKGSAKKRNSPEAVPVTAVRALSILAPGPQTRAWPSG